MQAASRARPASTGRRPKSNAVFAAHLVAAVAALCQPTAHAAPPSGGGSTTTTDLRGVTQNWDKTLPAEPGSGCPNWSIRFTCVMNNAAVRDNETGLVWEHPHPLPNTMNWWDAKGICLQRHTGNRGGWRLPTVTELSTLLDTSNPSSLKLPTYMPFIYNPAPGGTTWFWTSTPYDPAPYTGTARRAWVVNFQYFSSDTLYAYMQDVTEKNNVWCVRGGNESLGGTY